MFVSDVVRPNHSSVWNGNVRLVKVVSSLGISGRSVKVERLGVQTCDDEDLADE